MRDLTIANAHTYYAVAGAQPVLVHNCEIIAGPQLGVLRVTAKNPSASEIAGAEYMAGLGNRVTLRDPIGSRAGGQTSDLVVNGVPWDILTPTSDSVQAILNKAAKKHSQVHGGGVLIDLSGTNLSAADFGNALARINGQIRSWGKQPISAVDFFGGA
jgi:hypothetical protein